jgi:hypothetical protein
MNRPGKHLGLINHLSGFLKSFVFLVDARHISHQSSHRLLRKESKSSDKKS